MTIIQSTFCGEEFLVVLPDTSVDDAKDLAERIRLAVMTCLTKDSAPITCSIGVASHQDGQSILQLIKIADDRVYQAKNQGRNQVVSES